MVSRNKIICNKKGAIELSIGTVVIIVLGVSMLILGMVLVRNIMCGALGLTGDVNEKVRGELNKFFGASGGEVSCIGAGGEVVKIAAGQDNIVYCSVKAPVAAQYTISVVSYSGTYATSAEIKKWVVSESWDGMVAPGDDTPKKVVRLKIPNTAPEDNIRIQLQVKKNGALISSPDLDFAISRIGFVRSNLC